MSAAHTLKNTYVGMAQGLGTLLEKTGVDGAMKKREKDSRAVHWMHSLFAIHDMEKLVALDVPWWTYKAIDEVSAILERTPNARVFEYGSGASTVWLARRAASVTSIEHHAGWHERVTEHLGTMSGLAPVDLRLVEPDRAAPDDPIYASQKSGEVGQTFEAYAKAIETSEDALFDVIVIDGRARQACLKHAVSALAPNGVIVFDNSHRKRYRRAIEDIGFDVQCHRGLTPSLPYPDETTLLFHPR